MIEVNPTATEIPVREKEFKDFSTAIIEEACTDPGGIVLPKEMTSPELVKMSEEDFEDVVSLKWLEESMLAAKTKAIVSEVEREPRSLLSADLFEELKSYMDLTPDAFQEMSANLEQVLDSFAVKRFGSSMEEKTKRFLKNELVYLLLKVKEETQ